jgi:hypothetical protein
MPGKDIFLSYAGEDRSRIVPLARALEGTGWTVFWDRKIPTGKQWAEVLESEITTCRSVVVVWSQASVSSRWVRKEASEGDRRGVLLPVRIDDVEPPFEYREIQAADLIGWEGGAAATGFEGLVEDLALVLGRPPRQAGAGEAEPRRAEGEARPPVEEAARKAKEGGEARRFRRLSTRTLLASLGLAAGGGVLLAVVLLLVNPTPGPAPEPAHGVYTIQGKDGYLDVYPNNPQVVMADRQSDDSQRWVLERVSGNDYRIHHKKLTGPCLTPPGRKADGPATAAQRDCKSQLWVLTKVRDGVYYILQKSNEWCLTALEPSPYPWVGTRRGPCDTTQEWVLAPAP